MVFARRIALPALLLASIGWAGCAEEVETPASYRHNRYDYWLLRDRFPEVHRYSFLHE